MSKIQAELVEATGLKVSSDRQAFLSGMVLAISDLSDKEYDAISDEAQKWSNAATTAKNNKKPLPDFPDYVEPAAAPASAPATAPAASTRRRRAVAEEPSERITKVGDIATIITHRDKTHTGEVIEVTDKMTVLLIDNVEIEFPQDRIKSCTVSNVDADKSGGSQEPEAPELGEGDMATLTNKRGKVVTGKIVEMTDDTIVIDDGKQELEFARDRVASLDPVGATGTPAKADPDPPARSTRTRATPTPAHVTAAASDDGKPSVGHRVKELVADDMAMSVADVCKTLKKEGLEFREATVKINYADLHRFLGVLKGRGKLIG